MAQVARWSAALLHGFSHSLVRWLQAGREGKPGRL